MIKIFLKENKVITEQLSYPKDVFENIKNISNRLFNNNIHNHEMNIEASFKDILGVDSPVIKNGLVFYATLNDLGFDLLPDKIINLWNTEKLSFDDRFLEKIKNVKFILRLTIKDSGEKARVNMSVITRGDKKISRLAVQLNNKLLHSLSEAQREQAIKHELRHIFSQLLPDMCMQYGKNLAIKKDPKLVSKIKHFSDTKSSVGIGQTPLKIKAPSPEEAEQQGLLPHQAIDTYLRSDEEFEVWMSDLTAFYCQWLESKKLLARQLVDISTPEDIAVKYVSKLIKDVNFRKSFTRSNEEYAVYFRFIDQMLKNRQKEFVSKLIRYMTNYIKEKYTA